MHRRQQIVIEGLEEPGGDLGLAIKGGIEYNSAIYVSHILDNSSAARSGLKVGDRILNINGHDTFYMSHDEVCDLLRTSNRLLLWVKYSGYVPLNASGQLNRGVSNNNNMTNSDLNIGSTYECANQQQQQQQPIIKQHINSDANNNNTNDPIIGQSLSNSQQQTINNKRTRAMRLFRSQENLLDADYTTNVLNDRRPLMSGHYLGTSSSNYNLFHKHKQDLINGQQDDCSSYREYLRKYPHTNSNSK